MLCNTRRALSTFENKMCELQVSYESLSTTLVDLWANINERVDCQDDKIQKLEDEAATLKDETRHLRDQLLTRQVATAFEKKLAYVAFKDHPDVSRAWDLVNRTFKELDLFYRDEDEKRMTEDERKMLDNALKIFFRR